MLIRTAGIWGLVTLLSSAYSQTTSPYKQKLAELESCRSRFASTFENDSLHRRTTLNAARAHLLTTLTQDLLPAWYGTPWDFYGTTREPKNGKIACGYFVTTVLQDAGFRIPRIKWAQLAAEPMILKVAPGAKRYRETPVNGILTWLRQRGDGLYAVGLDNHVGFITVSDNVVRFVHSNYYQREIGVMAEPLEGNNSFAHSHYRVIGKLLDDNMMTAWLQGTVYR